MTIKSARKIATRKGCDIYLQELENDRYATYCVQYAENGKYFKSLEAAQNYIFERWRIRLAGDNATLKKGGERNGKNCER